MPKHFLNVLLLATLPLAATAAEPTYTRYTNPGLGFSVDIPAKGFTTLGESTSRDGQVFTGPHRAEIRAYGQWLRDPKAKPCKPESALPSAKSRITSTRTEHNTTIVKGRDETDYFLIKTIKRGDRCLYLRFVYPEQDAEVLDVVVGHVGTSFHD